MINHRLREAFKASGLTIDSVAEELDVDPKTVERWITQFRVPYPRHRARLLDRIGDVTEEYLWPDTALEQEEVDEEEVDEALATELANVYPHRASVPADLWRRLLLRARDRVAILVYAGQFLYEQQPQVVDILRTKAEAGTDVRLLLGDPDGPAVQARDDETGGADNLVAKVRYAQDHYRRLAGHQGITVRLHQSTLYNSIYRFDDEMLVHSHLYGVPAAHGPVVHLHHVPQGEMFAMYLRSFEHVWQDAVPAWSLTECQISGVPH